MTQPLTLGNYPMRLLAFFFITIFLAHGIGHCTELTDAGKLNHFLQRIEQKASIVKSFSCDFKQKKHLSIFNKAILFHGTLAIDRPDKMRWEIVKPLSSILLLDGENGLQCSASRPPKKFNTISDPIMKIVSKQLWSWLSGEYKSLRENYNISMTDSNEIFLTPMSKNIAMVVQSIQVEFDPTTLQPIKVTINEAGEDFTEIFFSNYMLNNSFPEKYFSLCISNNNVAGSPE